MVLASLYSTQITSSLFESQLSTDIPFGLGHFFGRSIGGACKSKQAFAACVAVLHEARGEDDIHTSEHSPDHLVKTLYSTHRGILTQHVIIHSPLHHTFSFCYSQRMTRLLALKQKVCVWPSVSAEALKVLKQYASKRASTRCSQLVCCLAGKGATRGREATRGANAIWPPLLSSPLLQCGFSKMWPLSVGPAFRAGRRGTPGGPRRSGGSLCSSGTLSSKSDLSYDLQNETSITGHTCRVSA